jgi:hypothetical protein
MAMGATRGETIFFTWIRAADGLEHAVRDSELAAAITHGDRCGYSTVCRYLAVPDRLLAGEARCCADCVNALPRNALPRRGRRARHLLDAR